MEKSEVRSQKSEVCLRRQARSQKKGFSFLLLAFGLALVTGHSSLLFSQQPQAQSGQPIYAVNAKYVQGVGPGYWPTAGSGLTLFIGAGSAVCDRGTVTYNGGTLTMTASSTSYVYLDLTNSCAPASNTTGFTDSTIPVATVVTGASTITSITDFRTWFAGARIIDSMAFADRFSGSDAGAKISSAIATLPATGGTVDARGLTGSQTASSTITIPAGIKLLLGNVVLTSSVAPVIKVNGNAAQVIGSSSGVDLSNGTIIKQTGAGNCIEAKGTVSVPIRGIRLQDLSCDLMNTGAIGLLIQDAREMIVDHVDLRNSLSDGVRVIGGQDTTVRNSRIFASASVGASAIGINITGPTGPSDGSDPSVVLLFENNYISGYPTAYHNYQCSLCMTSNVICESATACFVNSGIGHFGLSDYIEGNGTQFTTALAADTGGHLNALMDSSDLTKVNLTGAATSGHVLINPQSGIYTDRVTGLNAIGFTSPLLLLGGIQNIGTSIVSQQTVAPTPTVTPNPSGSTSWAYVVVPKIVSSSSPTYSAGAASSAISITNGPSTLNAPNYNTISWGGVNGANQFDVYRTTAGGTPNTTGKIGTVVASGSTGSNMTFNDTGLAGDGSSVPANTSGRLGVQTTNPSDMLEVDFSTNSAQGIKINSTTDQSSTAGQLGFFQGGTALAGILAGTPSFTGAGGGSVLRIDNNSATGPILFRTNGTQRAIINSNGTFGITGGSYSGLNIVASSATPNFDCSLGNTQSITLAVNVTGPTLSNCTAGQRLVFDIIEDATGGRTWTWPTTVKGGGTINTAASKHNVQMFYFDGTNAWAVSPIQSN